MKRERICCAFRDQIQLLMLGSRRGTSWTH